MSVCLPWPPPSRTPSRPAIPAHMRRPEIYSVEARTRRSRAPSRHTPAVGAGRWTHRCRLQHSVCLERLRTRRLCCRSSSILFFHHFPSSLPRHQSPLSVASTCITPSCWHCRADHDQPGSRLPGLRGDLPPPPWRLFPAPRRSPAVRRPAARPPALPIWAPPSPRGLPECIPRPRAATVAAPPSRRLA